MSQQCKCDDCLLGITDILAEVALLNLKIQRTTCTSKNGSEDRITGEDCGDNCCTNYPQNGGDDTDCNVLIRKVSKKRDRRIVYGEWMRYFVMMQMGNRATYLDYNREMLQNLPYFM